MLPHNLNELCVGDVLPFTSKTKKPCRATVIEVLENGEIGVAVMEDDEGDVYIGEYFGDPKVLPALYPGHVFEDSVKAADLVGRNTLDVDKHPTFYFPGMLRSPSVCDRFFKEMTSVMLIEGVIANITSDKFLENMIDGAIEKDNIAILGAASLFPSCKQLLDDRKEEIKALVEMLHHGKQALSEDETTAKAMLNRFYSHVEPPAEELIEEDEEEERITKIMNTTYERRIENAIWDPKRKGSFTFDELRKYLLTWDKTKNLAEHDVRGVRLQQVLTKLVKQGFKTKVGLIAHRRQADFYTRNGSTTDLRNFRNAQGKEEEDDDAIIVLRKKQASADLTDEEEEEIVGTGGITPTTPIITKWGKTGKLLGGGAFGHVFSIGDRAVKIIKGKATEYVLGLINTEINILEKLRRAPHVVHIIDSEQITKGDQIEAHILMERYDCDLDDYFKKGKGPKRERILDISVQMFRGLIECHKRDIVHMDPNLGNFLVRDDQLYVADFGLSKIATKGVIKYSGEIRTWSAPELLVMYAARTGFAPHPQFTEIPSTYSGKVDVWYVGCMIAEMVLKEHPRVVNGEFMSENLFGTQLPVEEEIRKTLDEMSILVADATPVGKHMMKVQTKLAWIKKDLGEEFYQVWRKLLKRPDERLNAEEAYQELMDLLPGSSEEDEVEDEEVAVTDVEEEEEEMDLVAEEEELDPMEELEQLAAKHAARKEEEAVLRQKHAEYNKAHEIHSIFTDKQLAEMSSVGSSSAGSRISTTDEEDNVQQAAQTRKTKRNF